MSLFDKPGSRRWTHFRSALQLAIQRSAHKWTFEDFAECFPLYVEEEKNGSSAIFNTISEHIEHQNSLDLEKLFKDYNVHDNIDNLHTIVNEAAERKANGEIGKDTWREDLKPRAAVCARTVPLLEAEVMKLRNTLTAMKDENLRLQAELEDDVKGTDQANNEVLELMDKLDKVHEEWVKLPRDQIEAWTVQTTESTGPIHLS